ncbi:hypothetical protein BEWA_010160 [Theileria equi strain WA]|uniref:Uncharacterized protein n=1 Tax=Theileria equi strain WA TaxID=1537102 RepID=L0B161_THEEQ|nr:hypothetical protein BEWA_010160 [Theileria equi strain WA]AFZ81602.1 hypothetical protein BEWA_010160 [Theileria equi strain WA]|eukprot:XP_004831268.1 hypothetical protein BEWA_010160 [Theileria equi strain WA]
MSRYGVPAHLSSLKQAVFNHLKTEVHTQLWLTGPKGRGKSRLINAILSEFEVKDEINHFSSYVDFGNIFNQNCQTLITRFADALISSVKYPKGYDDETLKKLFDDVLNEISSSNFHVKIFLKSIDYDKVDDLDGEKPSERINFSKLLKVYEEVIKINPGAFGFSNSPNIPTCWKCLYILNAVGTLAEIKEIEESNNINLSTSVTGKWVTVYLLKAIRAIYELDQKKWVLSLDGIESLMSTLLKDRGSDIYHRLPENFANIFDSNQFVYLEVPEIPVDIAMAILTKEFSCDITNNRALLKLSGGNYHLLNKCIENYRDFKSNVSLDTIKKILSGSKNEVDDEFFPVNKPKELQENYLSTEHGKFFIKNLYNACLSEDIIKFENSMNNFLSSLTMEELKIKLNNRVFETIRYLLKKRKLQIRKSCIIENKIILALISSNILHYQMSSNVVEFQNLMVERLLDSYMNSEFGLLTSLI